MSSIPISANDASPYMVGDMYSSLNSTLTTIPILKLSQIDFVIIGASISSTSSAQDNLLVPTEFNLVVEFELAISS